MELINDPYKCIMTASVSTGYVILQECSPQKTSRWFKLQPYNVPDWLVLIPTMVSSCQFPLELRERWIRSRDWLFLYFKRSTVSGFNILYGESVIDYFTCYLRVGDTYILQSRYDHHQTMETMEYYLCWRLVKVSSTVFMINELSDEVSASGFPEAYRGYIKSAKDKFEQEKACSVRQYPEFFTTLHQYGALLSTMKGLCPPPLLFDFTYDACNETELTFCPDRMSGVINYTLCKERLFHSVSGTVSCLGHVTFEGNLFINFFDQGNFSCLKLPLVKESTIAAVYFSGDCSQMDPGHKKYVTFTRKQPCPVVKIIPKQESPWPKIWLVVIACFALVLMILGVLAYIGGTRRKSVKIEKRPAFFYA